MILRGSPGYRLRAHMADALRDHDPELGKMRPKRVRQHRLLPDQQLGIQAISITWRF